MIGTSLLVIVLYSIVYPFTKGIRGDEVYSFSEISQGNAQISLLSVLEKSFYFSVTTFTTLGFGDFQPVGTAAQWLAGLESFLGTLLIALLVFTLSRRATR